MVAVGVQSFFPTGRAEQQRFCDWFRRDRRLRVCMRVCEFPLLTQTQTEVWALPSHRDTHASLFGQHQSSRSVQWQHLWQSTSSWKINWSSKLVCVWSKVSYRVRFSFWNCIADGSNAAIVLLCPPQVFLFKIPGNFNFFIGGGDFSLVFDLPAIFRVEFWNSWIGEKSIQFLEAIFFW